MRFGASATLNLRDGLPSAADARIRAERFLREHQVRGTHEALIITGRGNQSDDGVGVIREAVERLLHALRRQGVIAGYQSHNPGAFAVTLAPIRAMVEAPARQRHPVPPRAPAGLEGLDSETLTLLRELAEAALTSLGVTPDDATIADEMHRQLAAVIPALGTSAGRDDQLRAALRRAIAEYD